MFGAKKMAHRRKAQKYCCPRCAQLHYRAVEAEKKRLLAEQEQVINSFMYGNKK